MRQVISFEQLISAATGDIIIEEGETLITVITQARRVQVSVSEVWEMTVFDHLSGHYSIVASRDHWDGRDKELVRMR